MPAPTNKTAAPFSVAAAAALINVIVAPTNAIDIPTTVSPAPINAIDTPVDVTAAPSSGIDSPVSVAAAAPIHS